MVFHYFKAGYTKIKSALSKARSYFGHKINGLLKGDINSSTLEELERLLYEADFGVQTATALTQKVRELHQKILNLLKKTFFFLSNKNCYLF